VLSCLNQVQEQFTFKVEVLVVDGMSTDGTRKIVQQLSAQHPQVKLVDNPEKITPIALNRGIKAATGDVVMILGAHAELTPRYVEETYRCMQEHPDAGCVGGIIESEFADDVAQAIGLAQTASFGVGNAYFRTGQKSGYVDTVAFGAYKKEVFEKVGYFDEELVRNQDDEMNYRLTKNGILIYLDLAIVSKYYVRASLSKLYKQYEQYGFWKVYANKKHKAITTLRQLVPFFFVLFVLSAPLWWLIHPLMSIGYLAIWILYFALAIYSAYAPERSSATMTTMIRAFLILHFSYGWGYLKGIGYFLLLGKRPPANAAITR
jgi:GT2 family glycosyltransferase